MATKRQKRGNGHTLLQLDEAVGFADDYKNFGDILKAIKSHKKAFEILEKSLAIDSKNAEVAFKRVRMYFQVFCRKPATLVRANKHIRKLNF